ncbi:MAG: hypothetical protein Q7S27_01975 [Nanoarchaeota archaeon]|nr:hypothetical protein [Nanoarchaeota archaeon]
MREEQKPEIMTDEKLARLQKYLDENYKIPLLEVGKEYPIDLYPFGLTIEAGYKIEHCPPGPSSGSGEKIKAKYIGTADKGTYYHKHVFTFQDENKEISYAFFDPHWTREFKGVITYPFISSSSTECFTKEYFQRELPKRIAENDKRMLHIWEGQSKLVEILREIGEKI